MCVCEQCQQDVRVTHLGRRSNKATNMRNSRAERTDEQIQQDNGNVRVSMSQLRASQLQEARARRVARSSGVARTARVL